MNTNTKRIPRSLYNIRNNVIFALATALFVMLFAVVYNPTFSLPDEKLELWYSHSSLCIPIISAIVLLCIVLSRIVFVYSGRRLKLKEVEYLIWQLFEVLAICLFVCLFVSLVFHAEFFSLLPPVLGMGLLILVFPYCVYWLYAERVDRDVRIAAAQKTIVELRSQKGHSEPSMIRFLDEKGNVKLIVGADKVVSIESAGNYVNILYLNAGKLTRFSLRNTLKGIESLCVSNDLVRCHRSFFVNLHKIKLLKKDADGVFAQMDVEGVSDIPVSKMYSSDVVEKMGRL